MTSYPRSLSWGTHLCMCYAKHGTLFLPVHAKPAHVAQIPPRVQSVLSDGNRDRLGTSSTAVIPIAPGEDTHSQKAAVVNQEPDIPGFLPNWMLSMETQQGTSQRRRWQGSLSPGQLSAAEEKHSPRQHLDPVGGGL